MNSTKVESSNRFSIGDKVYHADFIDCFGKFHPRSGVETVIEIKLIERDYMPPYHRILTAGKDGYWSHEAAERFFEKV